jgi:hypothetical protein
MMIRWSQPAKHLTIGAPLSPSAIERLGVLSSWLGQRHIHPPVDVFLPPRAAAISAAVMACTTLALFVDGRIGVRYKFVVARLAPGGIPTFQTSFIGRAADTARLVALLLW